MRGVTTSGSLDVCDFTTLVMFAAGLTDTFPKDSLSVNTSKCMDINIKLECVDINIKPAALI